MKKITFTEDELNTLIKVIKQLEESNKNKDKNRLDWCVDVLKDWAIDWPNYLEEK